MGRHVQLCIWRYVYGCEKAVPTWIRKTCFGGTNIFLRCAAYGPAGHITPDYQMVMEIGFQELKPTQRKARTGRGPAGPGRN